MPKMHYKSDVAWTNYHKTLGALGPNGPQMTIKSLARIDATDTDPRLGLGRFAATAAALFEHLRMLEARLDAGEPPFAAGMVGQAWSFAPLIGTPESQLLCGGLSGVTGLAEAERHADCPLVADDIALAGGGVSMWDVAQWAETRDRTLWTSGSFLRPTIAGGFGTSSHGSRLGYGGIQDMVLGMHLIVGSGEHVWIEGASCPVLSQAALKTLSTAGKDVRLVRDDDQFEDALVHLGAMGIVNGVALALTSNRRFALMERMCAVTPAWLDYIAAGDFNAVAKQLGCHASPAFYELTVNPHGLFTDGATHTLYFPTDRAALADAGPAGIHRPPDAISQLGSALMARAGARLDAADDDRIVATAARREPVPPWVLRWILPGGVDSVFSYYFGLKGFKPANGEFDPNDPASSDAFKWSELHSKEITGGMPGALYNASFAVPLDLVAKALPAICDAVQDLSASFVFTVRFVCKPAGTLAFTRFDHNAVIEIDGLSPLICLGAKGTVDPDQPNAAEILRGLDELAWTLPTGAATVRNALEAAGIRYSMHWAKLGDLDQAKVYADYGHPQDPESLIRRWRETRDALLTDFGKAIFVNDAVVAYGLVEALK